ncbi:C-GCAxxG-C-C family (seleno)protein [Petroclostridium sp. X23]|uniref:C-GCAxxG-C-C family (seleno)protein n=1 Tax=Petroclostridium sp. X23 TaxID=3045146 RepID=UPI0024AC8C3E|nr:C-GCAxxG-C-C family (seleno)protein [Petroclostridium sp. X23]WHH59509.1 C-GCAxxG-C-C family (seleno)protein [Petroclostridium sp. X23]
MIEKAKRHYLGIDGYKRMNCAQSIICTFEHKYKLKDEIVEMFKAYGRGRAPEGLCGAYYAAKFLLEKECEGHEKKLEQYFLVHAGSTKCHEIRKCRKFSCLDCVEKSAELLLKYSNFLHSQKIALGDIYQANEQDGTSIR